MENENNEKTILNDEELKEVAGGLDAIKMATNCNAITDKQKCENSIHMCKWQNNKCVFGWK